MFARTRALAAAVVTAVVGVSGASLALAADDAPQYPVSGGSTFAAGLEGWTAADDSGCAVLGVLDAPLCSITNERVDDHEGSLQTTFTTLVNAVGIADGTGGFGSPAFTVPAGAQIGGASLTLQRRLTSDAPLLDSGAVAQLAVDLVDTTDPAAEQRTLLLDRSLDAGDGAWTRETVALPAGSLQGGHTYRLDARSRLTSEQVQALEGSVVLALDDIGVTTTPPAADGQDGATGAAGSTGETGQTGSTGSTGTEGSAGPAGTPGTTTVITVNRSAAASTQPTVNSARARSLLRLDRLVKVQRKGQYVHQMRVRVFCKRKVEARCEGSVKVRTTSRINTRLHGGKRLRKVTLGTGSYQLPRGRVGYAKVMLTDTGERLLKARGPFAVDVQLTVLDQDGSQQVLRKRFRAALTGR